MGYNNEGLPQIAAKVEEEAMQLLFILRIKTTRRLVGKYHLRTVHKGTGHSYTLLLAAREFGRLMVSTVGEAQEIEHLHRTASGIGH